MDGTKDFKKHFYKNILTHSIFKNKCMHNKYLNISMRKFLQELEGEILPLVDSITNDPNNHFLFQCLLAFKIVTLINTPNVFD